MTNRFIFSATLIAILTTTSSAALLQRPGYAARPGSWADHPCFPCQILDDDIVQGLELQRRSIGRLADRNDLNQFVLERL